MTHEDALRVASVIVQADGGCSHCVRQLVAECRKRWPEFDWQDFAARVLETNGEDYLASCIREPVEDETS